MPTYGFDSRAQKLLDTLGRPFAKGLAGLLGTLYRSIARELTEGAEAVTLSGSKDARGTGDFVVEVRFQPITAVTSVQRVDSNGSVLETYTVTGFADRAITVSGTTPPRAGDLLVVSYSYTHEGLELGVAEALSQLNVLTAVGDFLDRWGTLFSVPRLTGETDGAYGQRMISTVTSTARNTRTAIVTAVQRLTGGSPYLVLWNGTAAHRGFIFRPSATSAWSGGLTDTASQYHLIWGQTARFINETVDNGGAYVFDVYVPSGSGYTDAQILAVVNALKPAGAKAFIRHYN